MKSVAFAAKGPPTTATAMKPTLYISMAMAVSATFKPSPPRRYRPNERP